MGPEATPTSLHEAEVAGAGDTTRPGDRPFGQCRPRDSRTTAPRGRVTARLPVRPATTSPWAAPLLLLFRFLLRILVAAPRPAGTLLRSKPTGVEVVDSLLHLETDGTGPRRRPCWHRSAAVRARALRTGVRVARAVARAVAVLPNPFTAFMSSGLASVPN